MHSGVTSDLIVTKADILNCLTSDNFMDAIIKTLQPIFDKLSAEIDTINLKLRDQDDEISRLKATVALQEERLNTMESTLDEQPNRRSEDNSGALRVIGLPEDCQEAKAKLVAVVKENMGIDVQNDDITVVPLETQNTLATTPTSLETAQNVALVKFKCESMKRKLYRNRTKLKGTNIYVGELLNREQQKLFFECRKLKKLGKIMNTWTDDQKVFVKTVEDLQRQILSETELSPFYPPE